jgi:PEP-CTERM motif
VNTASIKKTVVTLAAVAALGASQASQAAAVDCDELGGMFDKCFAGLIIQPAKSPSFQDLSIGKFTLTALSDLAGFFASPGLEFSKVSLWSGKKVVSTDTDLSDGVSFADIGAGKYSVRVSGLVDGPKFSGYRFGAYAGGFTVTPSVPEPETYALFGAGLLAVFFMSRRRNGV